MKTKIIEAAQTDSGPNWGKFLLARMDRAEWERFSVVPGCATGHPLLNDVGWTSRHLWVLDLQTGEGAIFLPGGWPKADLDKHKVWVCVLFEPFLEWLYQQPLDNLDALPDKVLLPDAPMGLAGYRRPGTEIGVDRE